MRLLPRPRRVLAAIAFATAIAAFVFWWLTRPDPFPASAIPAHQANLENGETLYHAGSCHACHRPPEGASDASLPSGGTPFPTPIGVFYPQNITPDAETGIGKFEDKEIARALRNGVGHDGRALLPFMELQGLTDEDLTAVISYLRTQEPVHNLIPAHQYSMPLGMIVRATVLANPVGPSSPPAATSPHGANIENGRYLAESVALCWACHTQRNMQTGQLVSPRYSGSTGFDAEANLGYTWSPPNLTSDPETGRTGRMTEDEWVARFRAGKVIPGSPMPWQTLSRMNEEDIRAIYQYLKSLPPVKNDVGAPKVETAKKG